MSTVAVNEITDEVGTGSPAFTNGLAQSDIAGALNATGTAPIYACRAWVNFDGTDGSIRDSGNVSSITKNATGDYTVNFTTALENGDYSAVSTVATDNSSNRSVCFRGGSGVLTATSCQLTCFDSSVSAGGTVDSSVFVLSVFR